MKALKNATKPKTLSRDEALAIQEREGFPVYCALQGFNLQAFDEWLTTITGTGAHIELTERRASAWEAVRANNHDLALRHLEYMLNRCAWIARTDVLSPAAKHGAKFPGGRKKGAADPLTKAIAKHLKKHPDATAPEIWDALAAKATDDFRFEDGRQGKYHERWDAQGRHEVSFRTFTNKVSKERGILKRL